MSKKKKIDFFYNKKKKKLKKSIWAKEGSASRIYVNINMSRKNYAGHIYLQYFMGIERKEINKKTSEIIM